MKKEIEFLKEYVNTPSPSGHELQLGGQKVWMKHVEKFVYEVKTDVYGNAYAYYNKPNKDKKTVLIDAHADEIGFLVHDIDDSGYIKIARLGGSDILTTPASRVNIWLEDGTSVPGVFGHPAIHVQDKYEVKLENTFIDIGCSSREEVEKLGIEIGNPITMQDGFFELPNNYCGRSLDDKIGGFITSQVLKKLKENSVALNFNLVIVNAVMEEVGLYGAKLASDKIKPDVAIAIDVCHDTTSPAYNRGKQGHVVGGEGCVLMSAPAVQKNLLKYLKDTANEHDIKYQMITSGRGTGTNTDRYFLNGTTSALISMPMKYMHTVSETINKDDVQSAIDLLYESLLFNGIIQDFSF